MRAFIAIEISEEIRGLLDRIESRFKYAGADVKWVKPESIHMTLKFLGEITDSRKDDVAKALDDIAGAVKPFDLSIKEAGAFPGISRPRVIWAGLDKGRMESAQVAELVDESLSKLGFAKEERPFSPHLTIGRVRSPRNIDKLREKFPAASSDIQSSGAILHKVASIVLFQSTLTPQGSIYTTLHESQFRG